MRFIVDECTGPNVARWLRHQSHEVFSVYDESPGMTDQEILQKANDESSILITNDTDFGEMVFRLNHPHHGVILLRLVDGRSASKIAVLDRLIANYSQRLKGSFVVATESQIRFGSGRVDQ